MHWTKSERPGMVEWRGKKPHAAPVTVTFQYPEDVFESVSEQVFVNSWQVWEGNGGGYQVAETVMRAIAEVL